MLKSIQISQNPQDYRIFDLQISVEIAEEYYLWVLINEKPLKNNPIFFEVKPKKKYIYKINGVGCIFYFNII